MTGQPARSGAGDTEGAGVGEDSVADLGPVMTGRRRHRWAALATVAAVFGLLVAMGAAAGATMSYADSLEGRLLPGTVIAGADVGGLTQEEALDAVEAVKAADLDRTVTVRWRGRQWRTTAREQGARTDAREVIARTAASQEGMTWAQWVGLRWLQRGADVAVDVAVHHPRSGVRQFAAAIAGDVRRPPRDANVRVVKGRLRLTAARDGVVVRQLRLTAAVTQALAGGKDQVRLPVWRTKPEVTDKAYRQVLHLDQSEHRLTLYVRGKRRASWVVATGTGWYPTPLGQFEISEKRYLPTWVNPDPTGWGAGMPASIPPGVGNPLGLRALNWSGGGAIRFHGTSDIGSLGTSASHGCVRMANADVVALYDLVDVGAVILSEP